MGYHIQGKNHKCERYKEMNKSKKILIPIIIVIGFIPILTHEFVYKNNLATFDWFPANYDKSTDFFLGWKMIALIIMGIIMVAALLYQYLIKKQSLRFENSFYLIFFYLMFVAMAALFSKYKYWVVRGSYELLEPVWVVFTYVIICYYIYHFVQSEKQVEIILKFSAVGMAVVTLISVFQSFGLDFWKSTIGKHLMTNPDWWDHLETLQFSMADKRAYATLYNPNFLSLYFGLLIPLVACLIIGAHKVWQKILLAVCEVLCVLALIGSRSSSGWMALVLGAVVLVLVLMSRRKKLFYAGITVVVIAMVAGAVFCNVTSVGRGIRDIVVGTYHMQDEHALWNIKTEDNKAILNIKGNDLQLWVEDTDDGLMQLIATDADGTLLHLEVEDEEMQTYRIGDERFEGVTLLLYLPAENTPYISVTIDDLDWIFVRDTDGEMYYRNAAGNLVKYEQIKRATLFNEDAMSNRGYIWNDTLPLLSKHFLIGSGANTFLFEYPQNDYIRRYIYGDNYDVKAHSWYLQQCVESGVLATLLLTGFLLWYVIQSIRIYRRVDLHKTLSWMGFGFFSSVVVYLLVAIVNDSNVCTAPVFWGMLGLGMAVNRMLTEQEQLFVKAETIESDSSTHLPDEKADTNTTASNSNVQIAKKPKAKKQSRKQRKNNK